MAKTQKMKNITSRPTQTFNFATYGNNIPSVATAAAEIIWNAMGYGKHIDIRTTNGYFKVYNDGDPADMNHLFQYSCSNSPSEYSYYGTGQVQATAFFNPSNDDFMMWTHDHDGIIRAISAPFAETMNVGILDTVQGPKWHTTGYKVKDENNALAEYTEEVVGRQFALAILDDGYEFYFNGKKVKPVLPYSRNDRIDQITHSISTECGNISLSIRHINLSDKSISDSFPVSMENQGLYMFYNGCFIGHYGVSLFSKSNSSTKMKAHPSLNKIRTIVDIITEGVPSPIRIPFTNNKTTVKWSMKAGRILANLIDENAGMRYRDKMDSVSESVRRKKLDIIMNKVLNRTPGRGVSYCYEAEVMNGLKADAILYTGSGDYSLSRVLSGELQIAHIIEFKPDKLAPKHGGQALTYASAAKRSNKRGTPDPKLRITPVITLVGKELTIASNEFMDAIRDEGYDVEFIAYDDEAITKQLRAEGIEV